MIFDEKLRVFFGFLRFFTNYFFGVRRFCAPHLNGHIPHFNRTTAGKRAGKRPIRKGVRGQGPEELEEGAADGRGERRLTTNGH